MVKVYFFRGKYIKDDGDDKVRNNGYSTIMSDDDFMIFGDAGETSLNVFNGSVDAQYAQKISDISLRQSSGKNINADAILLNNSSISSSSANQLVANEKNNTVNGVVLAKSVGFNGNAVLDVSKNSVLKVSDKNALDFSRFKGDGKIYDAKTHAYYNTKNEFLEYEKNINLSTLNAGDGNEAFSFDGNTLVLNKGYEFSISGDKAINIVNNAVILKADISGVGLKSISGGGSIKELNLSTNANPVINTNVEYINPLNLNLNALQNSNGSLYNFDGVKLVLNKGYEFSLSGDKPAFIVNNGTILEANINGKALKSIASSGSIEELHLSNEAEFSINSDFGNAVIEKGSVLTLFKQVDFSKLSGDGYVNINGTIYNTDGHALNNAKDSLVADIREYDFAIAKEIKEMKEQKDGYINVDKQNSDVDLLNIEMANNDNLL